MFYATKSLIMAFPSLAFSDKHFLLEKRRCFAQEGPECDPSQMDKIQEWSGKPLDKMKGNVERTKRQNALAASLRGKTDYTVQGKGETLGAIALGLLGKEKFSWDTRVIYRDPCSDERYHLPLKDAHLLLKGQRVFVDGGGNIIVELPQKKEPNGSDKPRDVAPPAARAAARAAPKSEAKAPPPAAAPGPAAPPRRLPPRN